MLKRREAIYLICYSAFIITMFLFEEVVNKPRVRWVICPCLALGMLSVIVIEKKHFFRQLLIRLAILLLFGLAAVASGKPQMVVYGALFCGAGVTDFKNIVKTCIGTSGIIIAIVAIANLFRLTPYTIFYRSDGTRAYSFGFGYYSIVPYTYLFTVLGYLFLRKKRKKKVSYIELIIILIINYILFRLTTVRITFYLCYLVIVLYIVLIKLDLFDFRKKVIQLISVLIFPLFFGGTLWLNYNFTMQNPNMILLNNLMSNRLFLGHLALERYKIGLFGQEILTSAEEGNRYFYVDSGYLYSLIGYGILFTLLALIIYISLIKIATEENDKIMFIWILTVAIFTFSNNTWISLYVNPLLLYYPIIIEKIKKRSLEEKVHYGRKKRKRPRLRLG